MEDSCYICRRTRVDLERLNEEVRTRVYLSYFSNARAQIDEQRRRITFLQRLKDEESGDPHFRINAKQVFGDPMAYKKLMPWIETLIETTNSIGKPRAETLTIGELVEALFAEEHATTLRMEEGLNEIRSGFATGKGSPFNLEVVAYSYPVEWSTDRYPFTWHASTSSEREPLVHPSGASKAAVEMPIHLCSICRKILASR
jgi:hypothetical protein